MGNAFDGDGCAMCYGMNLDDNVFVGGYSMTSFILFNKLHALAYQNYYTI